MVVSCSSPWSRVVYCENLIDRLAAFIDYEALFKSTSMKAFNFYSYLSPLIRWQTLSLSASEAGMGYPVKIIFIAILVPIILGRIWVPPIPGMIPRLIYGNPKDAFSEATMISVSIAS